MTGVHTNQDGTTLIEVLVAILLLSVGLLGLVAVNGRTLQSTVDSENRGTAALLANEIVTQAWNLGSDTSPAFITARSALCTPATSVLASKLPSPTCTSTLVGGTDTTGAVTIMITWTAPGQQGVTSKYFTTVALP